MLSKNVLMQDCVNFSPFVSSYRVHIFQMIILIGKFKKCDKLLKDKKCLNLTRQPYIPDTYRRTKNYVAVSENANVSVILSSIRIYLFVKKNKE